MTVHSQLRQPLPAGSDEPAAAAGDLRPPGSAAAPPPSLRRNASWMFSANLVYAGCQWALLSLLAHLTDAAEVGKYVLATAIVAPVMAFCMLGLRSVQATDARGEFPFHVYLRLRIAALVVAAAAIAVVTAAAGHAWETTSVIWALAAAASLEAISDLLFGALQRRERLGLVAQSLILRSVLGAGGFAVVLWLTGGLAWAVLAVAAARLAVLLCWDIPRAGETLAAAAGEGSAPRPSGRSSSAGLRAVAALALQTLPLGVVMMLIALGTAMPRYFIEHLLGEEAVGIFGAIAYFSFVGVLAVGAAGQSAAPRLAASAAEGRRGDFFRLLARLAGFGAALGAAGLLLSLLAARPLLHWTYGPQYAAHHQLLSWLMAAAVLAYPASFAGFSLTAARCFRIQVPLYAAVVAATAAGCHYLIPLWGMAGAAAAWLIGAAVQIAGAAAILCWSVPRRAPSPTA